MGKIKDLTGQKFGRLTALSYTHTKGYAVWTCICECGKTTSVISTHLITGHTKSCGCLIKENYIKATPASIKACTKHKECKTRIYSIFHRMKGRCYNKNNKDYKDYGGRGIIICNEWLNDYTVFRKWAMENGYKENLTIDRIDVNGNYEPSNCRWATNQIQQLNKRNNRLVTINGETKSILTWARIYNLNLGTLYNRLTKGINVIDAITTPVTNPRINARFNRKTKRAV